MNRAPDQDARDAAVAERTRNVVIDAGAGTGKTSTIVRRLVQLVAPEADGDALEISRIAAITFTRKAAGELQQRIRKELARGLKGPGSALRRARIEAALTAIDTAHIGTIHAFADRLLRDLADLSGLGPQYEILEDIEPLTGAVTSILLQAASQGAMLQALHGTRVEGDAALADEVAETILLAQRADLRAYTRETLWVDQAGLSALVHELCLRRDNPPATPQLVPLDLDVVREGIEALRTELDRLDLDARRSAFGVWLSRWVRDAEGALEGSDPAQVFRVVSRRLDRLRSWRPSKGHTCDGDPDAWFLCKRLVGEAPGQRDPERGELAYDRENLQGPLATWMGTRLARLAPAVLALYERLKAEQQAVDQIDLLLQLRNLLRDDLVARRRCQAQLDHVFVDEFQDTDPLQAEIVMFLVEDGQRATTWSDVRSIPGKLTIVGDPKQSIYRFRRADVVMYDRVRRKLLEHADEVLAVELTANFRSLPPIIDWLGQRCENLLGKAPDPDTRFDPATGQVFQRALVAGRDGDSGPAVHVLPIDPATGLANRPNVETTRALAAEAVARWIRRLLDDPKASVIDPHDGTARRPRAGDIAVLTPVTTTLEPVFAQLDRFDVPYAVSGGRLFLGDPLHQTFLLALRALAGASDREIDDGAALAALYSPPVFGLDLRALAHARAPIPETGDDPFAKERARVQQVGDVVRELRRHRGRRSPGETARLLLERSGLGPTVALRPNGTQRLRRLHEMCHVVEHTAKARGLDFDGVTRQLVAMLDDPPQLDAPPPLGEHAVSVLTIHQAKGLEFPIVILWDPTAPRDPRRRRSVWTVDRDAKRFAIALDGLQYDSAGGDDGHEGAALSHELKRLYYVACTRARDMLVLTTTIQPCRGMHGLLVPKGAVDDHPAQRMWAPHSVLGSSWGDEVSPASRVGVEDTDDPYEAAREAWVGAWRDSARPIARPQPVAAWAHREAGKSDGTTDSPPGPSLGDGDPSELDAPGPAVWRRGRHGVEFGNAVHGALDLVVRAGASPADAVAHGVAASGVAPELRPEVQADVDRGLQALRRVGLLDRSGVTLRPEYPIVGRGGPGEMLVGVIDLIAADDDTLWILDYKTDHPPTGDVALELWQYVAQVRAYAEIVKQAGLIGGRAMKLGLLFTADGAIRWV